MNQESLDKAFSNYEQLDLRMAMKFSQEMGAVFNRNPLMLSQEEIEGLADAAKIMADAEGDFRPNAINQDQVQKTEVITRLPSGELTEEALHEWNMRTAREMGLIR